MYFSILSNFKQVESFFLRLNCVVMHSCNSFIIPCCKIFSYLCIFSLKKQTKKSTFVFTQVISASCYQKLCCCFIPKTLIQYKRKKWSGENGYNLNKVIIINISDKGLTVGSSSDVWEGLYSRPAVPNLFGTRDQFHGRQFFHEAGWGLVSGWFKSITLIEHFISIIIVSPPFQIIKH